MKSTDQSVAKREKCPMGKVGHVTVVNGVCYECEGEEAARRARLEERGIFLGRLGV